MVKDGQQKRLRQTKKQTIHRKIHQKTKSNNRTRLLQPHIPIQLTNRTKKQCLSTNNKKTKPRETAQYKHERRNQRTTTPDTN